MYTYKEEINPAIATINELAKKGWRLVGVGLVNGYGGADRVCYFEKHVDKSSD